MHGILVGHTDSCGLYWAVLMAMLGCLGTMLSCLGAMLGCLGAMSSPLQNVSYIFWGGGVGGKNVTCILGPSRFPG